MSAPQTSPIITSAKAPEASSFASSKNADNAKQKLVNQSGFIDLKNLPDNKSIRALAAYLGTNTHSVERLFRLIISSGDTKTLASLRKLLDEKVTNPDQIRNLGDQLKAGEKSNLSQQKIDKQFGDIFTARSELLKGNFQAQSTAQTNTSKAASEVKDTLNNLALKEQFIQELPKLLTSPRAFASFLINNKSIALWLAQDKNTFLPVLTSLLMVQNNQINSPGFLAELMKLISQILKLKQGKSTSISEEEDEQVKHDQAQEEIQEELAHQNQVVQGLKDTVETTPIKSVQHFLLEAERFAEEEIAHLWSLTLKKEKELINKIKSLAGSKDKK